MHYHASKLHVIAFSFTFMICLATCYAHAETLKFTIQSGGQVAKTCVNSKGDPKETKVLLSRSRGGTDLTFFNVKMSICVNSPLLREFWILTSTLPMPAEIFGSSSQWPGEGYSRSYNYSSPDGKSGQLTSRWQKAAGGMRVTLNWAHGAESIGPATMTLNSGKSVSSVRDLKITKRTQLGSVDMSFRHYSTY